MNKIEKFLKKHKEHLQKLGANYPEKKSIILEFQELERFDRNIADELRENPDEKLLEFEDTLNSMNIPTEFENPNSMFVLVTFQKSMVIHFLCEILPQNISANLSVWKALSIG